MAEFKVNNIEYRSGKMNAIVQFHVARRLAPVFAAFGEAARTESRDPMLAFGPMAEAFAKMSDQDAEYVINACLGVCLRKQNNTWVQIRTSGGIMFDDIGLQEMIQISWATLQDNLSGFFAALPRTSPDGAVQQG